MDDLERRVLSLELETRHERELTEWRICDLQAQLRRLEHTQTRRVTPEGLKIAIAVLLPIAVWLLTGDLRKALAALRLGAG